MDSRDYMLVLWNSWNLPKLEKVSILWASARLHRLTATLNNDTLPYPIAPYTVISFLRFSLLLSPLTAKEIARWRWPVQEDQSNFLNLMSRGTPETLDGVMLLTVQ